jgi:hypothetical protein
VRTDRVLAPLLIVILCACSSTGEPRSSASAPKPRLSESALAARIERGRALLDAGRPAEAQAEFAEAAAADGDSLRTRMWILRCWMDQGRSNDTLDALDELSRAGAAGPEMNYLYGMAFARRAEGHMAQGVTDSSVEMNFQDAKDRLVESVKTDAVRYHDAFLALAHSAWFTQDLETARWAADRAVDANAGSAEVWLTRGRIALSQFLAAQGEQPGGAEAEALWADATTSFRNAVERSGSPTEEAAQVRLAEAATQLGHAMLWKKKGPEATDAYATAIAWDPLGFEYARAVEFLGGVEKTPGDERSSGFGAALELAKTRFEAHAAPGDPRTATLLWWLGWARFSEADWSGSESAFQDALALSPEFANAWFYIGLARQYRKDSEGAIQAMHAGWDTDPSDMVRTVAGAGGALRAFESLLSWCAAQEPARNLDAAFLAEMLAQAMPDEARHWNNMGLFLRNEGEDLELAAYKKKAPEPDPALLEDLYARSFAAYQRALELNPGDPQLVNDTALMLAYHLDGDLAEVEGMYRRALALTESLLANEKLSAEDRARFEQTKKDIDVNLKYLLAPDTTDEEEKAVEAGAEEADAKGTAAAASGGGG